MKAMFGATALVSATLLFLIQPMVGKMFLPRLGGSPAVWVTCMVFFQATLLAGYLYAHLIATRLSARWQVVVHITFLFASAACLPIALPKEWPALSNIHPVPWLLGTLAWTVGLPFFAV